MYRSNLRLVRGIFGALVVGTLGFGASQALASPAPAATLPFCTASQRQACVDNCRDEGKSNARCTTQGSQIICECY